MNLDLSHKEQAFITLLGTDAFQRAAEDGVVVDQIYDRKSRFTMTLQGMAGRYKLSRVRLAIDTTLRSDVLPSTSQGSAREKILPLHELKVMTEA